MNEIPTRFLLEKFNSQKIIDEETENRESYREGKKVTGTAAVCDIDFVVVYVRVHVTLTTSAIRRLPLYIKLCTVLNSIMQ